MKVRPEEGVRRNEVVRMRSPHGGGAVAANFPVRRVVVG